MRRRKRRRPVLKRGANGFDVDGLVILRELEALRIGLDLCRIEAVGDIDEVVLHYVFNLEVAGDLADLAADIEEQLPAFREVIAPFLRSSMRPANTFASCIMDSVA